MRHLCQDVVNARMWFTFGVAVNELLGHGRVTDVSAQDSEREGIPVVAHKFLAEGWLTEVGRIREEHGPENMIGAGAKLNMTLTGDPRSISPSPEPKKPSDSSASPPPPNQRQMNGRDANKATPAPAR